MARVIAPGRGTGQTGSTGLSQGSSKMNINRTEHGTRHHFTPVLVIDLEATCEEYDPAFDMETIEIGACWIAADGSVLDRFQSFVRPVVNPTLTPFCTQLTGITQADVDAAPLFPVAADALRGFVAKHQQAG